MADEEPTLRLEEGRRLLDAGDLDGATRILSPLTGHPDATLAADAWLAIGTARYRADDEPGALVAWQQAAPGPPPAERGAIANRIAWLLKETGHDFAARRQFNRARGAYAPHTPYVTYAIIAICVALFGIDTVLSGGATLSGGFLSGSAGPLGDANLINAFFVAQGEWWRIITSAFFHLGPIHLAFNMYVLYLYGAVVERMYGSIEYAGIYLLCA